MNIIRPIVLLVLFYGILSPVMVFGNEFFTLTPDQQKQELTNAFTHRLELAKNVSFRVDNVLEIRTCADEKPGELLGTRKRNFVHRQLGQSFQVEAEIHPKYPINAVQHVFMLWNADEGFFKSFIEVDPSTHLTQGHVDTQYDPMLVFNKYYLSWIDGGNLDPAENGVKYIFPYLLEHRDEWEITKSADGDKIELSMPYLRDRYIACSGRFSVILDPKKGYFPIQGTLNFDGTFQQSEDTVATSYRRDFFEVRQSEQVQGIWMPTELYTFLSVDPDRCNVNIAKVSNIVFGKLQPTDLELKFPEGTEVIDAIKGIYYETDANGEPIEATIEAVRVLDTPHIIEPPEMPETKPDRKINYPVMILGLSLIVVALYYLHRRV